VVKKSSLEAVSQRIVHWENLMRYTTPSAAGQSEHWSTLCGEISTSGPLGMVLSGTWENRDVIPKSAYSYDALDQLSNTQFLGPTSIHIPNGIPIGSAIIEGLVSLRTDQH